MHIRFALALALVAAVISVPTFALADETRKDVRKKEAEKRFAKLPEYCKGRRVTHVVELLAEWREFANADQQDELMAFVTAVVADAKAEAKGTTARIGRPQVGYRGTRNTTDVKDFQSGATTYFLDQFELSRSDETRNQGLALEQHVIVASRTFVARGMGEAEGCVILTNAPTAVFRSMNGCIVFSSGSVTVDKTVRHSAVVCRGDASFKYDSDSTPLVKAGGAITHPDIGEKGRLVPDLDPKTMFANDTKLLGMKFYSTAEDGLTTTAKKGVVTVSKVDEAKALGKAGVKAGDVIESINGQEVPTLHELDRLLCRATVASGVAKLKVKRNDKVEVIEVKLADW